MARKTKAKAPDRAQSRSQFLALHPLRNPQIEWEETENRVVLSIQRPNNWKVKIINIFFPVPDERKVVLDPLGSHVWRMCDGKTSVDEISRDLQREYKLGGREAELSLRQFFQDLAKRGYLGFAVKK